MYAYITKGYTVGYALTRRLFRNITSIPGVFLDTVFVAPFWLPSYSDFWRDASLSYADGTRASGYLRIIFGYVGDIPGAIAGAVIGAGIGFGLYVTDSIFSAIRWSLLTVGHSMKDLAYGIGKHSFFATVASRGPALSYRQMAWNLSIATLGWLLGTAFYVPIKMAEFFLPMGSVASKFAWNSGIYLGGVLGAIISIPTYPVFYTLRNIISFYDKLRQNFSDTVAFVYSKTDASLYQNAEGECVPAIAVHSDQFREKVNTLKQTSTMSLFYGAVNIIEVKPSAPPIAEDKEDLMICPITQQQFVHPVIDRKGHTFEETAIKEWIRSKHNATCPVGREPIAENDLAPNRALETFLKRG